MTPSQTALPICLQRNGFIPPLETSGLVEGAEDLLFAGWETDKISATETEEQHIVHYYGNA